MEKQDLIFQTLVTANRRLETEQRRKTNVQRLARWSMAWLRRKEKVALQ